MAKDYDYVFDLGKFTGEKTTLGQVVKECAAARAPPLTPAEFALALSSKSFTSKKADEKMVADLYKATFDEQMGKATKLDYRSLQWGDEQVTTLCKVLAGGALAKLERLDLGSNPIGDAGLSSLADVCAQGCLPSIKQIWLRGNQATEVGKQAMRDAAAARGFTVEV